MVIEQQTYNVKMLKKSNCDKHSFAKYTNHVYDYISFTSTLKMNSSLGKGCLSTCLVGTFYSTNFEPWKYFTIDIDGFLLH